ncbi:MAG: hypothetical protein GZ088_03720 [Acidipila sp.]|nr:hypothetical protein [Acidipila sp.]
MLPNKSAPEVGNATLEVNPDTLPIPEKQRTTMPGTVEKIIPAPHPGLPEKAQISIEGADHLYRELRIENKLSDENGEDVKLKKGAHVEISVSKVDDTKPHE